MRKANNRKLAILVLIGLIIIQAGCSRGPRNTRPDKINAPVDNNQEVALSKTDVEHTMPTVNLFIENSASMNGYIKGFKPAIKNLVVDLKRDYVVGLNFINKHVLNQPINDGQDPINVVSDMLDNRFTVAYKDKKDIQSTKLNDIIKLVLEKTNDTTVSILVSDCIYSIKDGRNTTTNKDKLKDLMVETKNQFSNKYSTIDDLSVLFIRLKSNFKGQYFDYNDSPIDLDCIRPYFMCVIGTDKNLREFMGNINIKELEGYFSHYYLSGKDLSNTFYSVVSQPYSSGIYPIVDNRTIRPRNTGTIRFAIAINMDDFPMTEEEKMDIDNYAIDSTYVLEKIETIDDNTRFSPNEKSGILEKGCTHLLVVSSKGYPSDFVIKVRRTIPNWIEEFSSIDDTSIRNKNQEQLEKTFGIAYFINGVADAFRTNSRNKDSYFTMNIKIKH